ncbi:hypothetical protein AAF712_010746 [Marasmius tenuissimus]|uniref:F-box domain-containing protein n=1 Tax=Marasmius tenuissimus TaxID=585030 RepID=A0ABR2ZL44_9AGAR|nr:hypothetical protein PM082_014533 [Marasmius tenuissimus]
MAETQTNGLSPSASLKQSTSTSARCPDCNFDLGASQNKIQGPPEALYSSYSVINAYPSVKEEKAVKTGIAEAVAQISLIGNKIERLNETITLLGKERDRLEEVTSKYRSILRPVFRLPPEVLARIFSLSVDTPAVEDADGFRGQRPPTSLRPTKHPWVLSQVCQSWRSLALNTPSLWSFVSFTIPSNNEGEQPLAVSLTRYRRLQLQLRRSASTPLDITVEVPDPNSPSLERFLSLLCYNSPRWRHLSIELHGDRFLPWMSSITGHLQTLQSLHIKLIGTILTDDFDCFEFAPQLRSIIISADRRISAAVLPFRKLKLPHEQITHHYWQDMELEGISNQILIRILTLSHIGLGLLVNLRSYRLLLHSESIAHYGFLLGTEIFASGQLTVTLRNLVELDVRSINVTSGIHVVLPFIKAPSLEKLAILSSGPDHTTLSAFFTISQKLISLSIHRVEMPPNKFSIALTGLTSLNNLSFGVAQIGGISDEYISLLRQRPTGGFSLIPKLESLSLFPVQNFPSTYTPETLIDVLEARWRVLPERDAGLNTMGMSHSQLHFVKLDNPIDDERLDQLRIEGLQVEVWGGN